MSRKKPGLTATRHVELGERLTRIRDELLSLSIEVANSYPRTGKPGKMASALSKSVEQVDTARCLGDDISCLENPDTWSASWYYPGRKVDN